MKFYMGIKPEKKIVRDGYEKYLLRKAFEEDLPQEKIMEKEKMVFQMEYLVMRNLGMKLSMSLRMKISK